MTETGKCGSGTYQKETAECPFTDCDWTKEYDPDDYHSELSKDFAAEEHYEREHAGRIDIQVTLEKTQLLGDRDPEEIRERLVEKAFPGFSVAHVRTDVVEEADDHSKVRGDSDE